MAHSEKYLDTSLAEKTYFTQWQRSNVKYNRIHIACKHLPLSCQQKTRKSSMQTRVPLFRHMKLVFFLCDRRQVAQRFLVGDS